MLEVDHTLPRDEQKKQIGDYLDSLMKLHEEKRELNNKIIELKLKNKEKL